VTVAGIAPAFTGVSASATEVPPIGAGMSSVTVNVAVPPGATVLAAGVSEARTGSSAAPRTRTFAMRVTALYVAESVTLFDCARPLSSTVAEV
jgi:hypothetical protein